MLTAKQVNIKINAIGRTFCALITMWVALCWCEGALAEEPAWRSAPIRLRVNNFGSIDYRLTYRNTERSSSAYQRTSLLLGVGVTATSFFWQPWLAVIVGGVKASVGYSIQDSGKEIWKLHRTSNSLGRTVTGNADLNILPRSRFPFSIGFERTDMRSEFGSNNPAGDAGSVTDYLRVNQRYSSSTGKFSLTTHYVSSQTKMGDLFVGSSQGTDMDVSMRPFEKQALSIHANKQQYKRDIGTEWSSKLVSRHTYFPDDTFAVATLASKIKNESVLAVGDITHEVLQFNSSSTLRPSDTRLTMVSGVYLHDSYRKLNGVNISDASFTGANLGANFAWNKWIRLYGSASVYDNKGVQSVTSTSLSSLSIALALRHNAESVKLGVFNYSRAVAMTLSNTASNQSSVQQSGSVSASGNTQGVSSELHHGLNYGAKMGAGSIGFNFRQWLTSSASRSSNQPEGTKPIQQAKQTASLAWSRSSSTVRLYGSTSRQLSGTKPYFQSINLQSTQGETLGSESSLSGNLTVNASRQGYEAADVPSPEAESVTSSASLIYLNMRAFNVRDMKLSSTLQLTSPELIRREGQSWNQGRYKWDTTLSKTIAKLTTELRVTLEDIQSTKQLLLFFNANRQF